MGDRIEEREPLAASSDEGRTPAWIDYESTDGTQHSQSTTFAVDVMGFMVFEPLSLDHSVDWLSQTVQQSYHRLFSQQRDLPIAYVRELYSPQLKCNLSPGQPLSTYFGSPQFTRQKKIRLVAFLSDSVPTINDDDDMSTHEASTVSGESHSTTGSAVGEEDPNKWTAESHRLFYSISFLSLVWKPRYEEHIAIKLSRLFGQCSFILMALFYVVYFVYCPFLGRKQFAFTMGEYPDLARVYFVVQGGRYLFLYILGMWLSYKPHIHHAIRKCSVEVVGLDEDSEWSRIRQFINKRGVISIVLIVMPGLTVIPAFANLQDCRQDLTNDTLGLLNSTVPLEVGGYILFCFISLPVFLTILFIAKLHVAELRKFSSRILKWRADDLDGVEALFQTIQGAIRHSSEHLHWILSVYYFVMLLWMNACGWFVVNSWIEFHKEIKKVDCWIPPFASRYTIVFATQLVWFYGYPLYYFHKFQKILKSLIVIINAVDIKRQNRKGYLIQTPEIRRRLATMVTTGLEHEPRFVVFWCLPMSVFTTIVLLCITPVLPVVWNLVAEVR